MKRALTVWVLCALGAIGCSRSTSAPRYVVMVSLDTLRADHLGAYGYDRATSPNLDALVERSVLFEQAMAHAPSTVPSHRALFESRLPSRTSKQNPSLAETLSQHGYRAAAFTGGGYMGAKFGFARGFEHFDENLDGLASSFDDVADWLRQIDEQPFFLLVHTYDIHLPYDPPPPYDTRFLPDYQGDVVGPDTTALLRKLLRIFEYRNWEGKVVLSEADKRKIEALYDGGILYTDQFLGELIELLEELDLWEDTLLVVLSDHGEEFWDHGSVLHSRTLHQELLHVPLILRLPGDRHGGLRIQQAVGLMDVAPTILDLLRIPRPPSFEGRSLLELLEDPDVERPPVVSQIGDRAALLDYPWKLITGGRVRLFDLRSDPSEQTNVASENPEVVSRLKRAVAAAGADGTKDIEAEPTVEDPAVIEELRALGYVD